MTWTKLGDNHASVSIAKKPITANTEVHLDNNDMQCLGHQFERSNFMKRFFAMCLSVLMAATLCVSAFAVQVDSESSNDSPTTMDDVEVARVMGTGTITGNYVNVRTGPSTDYPVITQVNKGDRVGVLHFTKDENSSDPDEIWFYCVLSKTGERGYIYYQYVRLDPEEIR